MEFVEGLFAEPQQCHHHRHNHQLIERIPSLHIQGLEMKHEELVVESTRSPKQHACQACPKPLVLRERDALLMPNEAYPHQRHEAQHDTNPLERTGALAEDDERTHKHQNGANGIDGGLNSERQVFDGEIAQQPRSGHYHRFHEQIEVAHGVDEVAVHITKGVDQHWRHEQSAKKGVEEQHVEHVVALKRQFFNYVVKAEANRRDYSQYYPHIGDAF